MNFVKSNIKPLHTALNALATVALAAVFIFYGSDILFSQSPPKQTTFVMMNKKDQPTAVFKGTLQRDRAVTIKRDWPK
jgi:hypothetical protein